jgi:hypothetical protein
MCLWNMDAISKDVFNKVWSLLDHKKRGQGLGMWSKVEHARGPGLHS